MARTGLKATAVILALAMGLSACAHGPGMNGGSGAGDTTSGSAGLTPAEQKMREQADTFNQTIGEGAMVGCIAGAILGALLVNDKKGQGALIGCGAGAAVGAGAGYMVASTQESYATEEARLDAMIGDLRSDNTRLASLIDSSRSVIAADKAEIDRLDQKIATGQITAKQAKADIAKVDSNIDYLTKTVASLKKRQEEYQLARKETPSDADGKRVAAMDAEISQLSVQIASLEQNLDGLMARRKISRVG